MADVHALIRELTSRMHACLRAGAGREAESVARELLRHDPVHALALGVLGGHAFERGEYEAALGWFQRAADAHPGLPLNHQNLGLVLRALGRRDEACAAFSEAIRLNPKQAAFHLQLGKTLAEQGELEASERAYRDAAALEPRWMDPALWPQMPMRVAELCREAVAALAARHERLHQAELAELEARHGAGALSRMRDFLAAFHKRQAFPWNDPLQQPSFQFLPGLPAAPWFEREDFPFLAELEQAWEVVRDELVTLLREQVAMQPYVPGELAQSATWSALAASTSWSSYHLLKAGKPIAEHVARCPKTHALLQRLPLVELQGNAPEAFFSVLKPQTHIPPHFGLSNTKLAVHLPLVVPEHCAIRVGSETRGWVPGECRIFDDSFEHEAWNRSGEYRAVLIFEIWNPHLTPVEREALQRFTRVTDDWYAFQQLAV